MTTAAVRYINPEGCAPAQGLYSHAAALPAQKLFYVAGQLAVGPDGSVVGKNDFEAQFRQVFKNLADVLKGLGVTHDGIVKFNTYLVRSQDIEAFMKLRAEYFPTIFKGPLYPPNTLLVVDRMVKEDFLFEVEAVVSTEG